MSDDRSAYSGGKPADHPPSAPPSTQPADPRLDLLGRWLAANDANDSKAAIDLARELRRLGLSIVPVTAKGGGGGR